MRRFGLHNFFTGKLMKKLLAVAVAPLPLLVPGVSSAQTGPMMNGGMWGGGWMGGYGGFWVPILLIVVVAGLVVWLVKRK